jgi:hypothetical protein
VDAPLAEGCEDSHPALMVASMSNTAATGIRIPERDSSNTRQSWHALPIPRNAAPSDIDHP